MYRKFENLFLIIKNIFIDIRQSMSVDGTTISNPMANSNVFNNYFSSMTHKTKLGISY